MERLELRGIHKRFGSLQVTRDVSFALQPGERTALIGPNGAGKTTLVNLICGHQRADAGSIHFEGKDIGALGVAERARLGLVRTFQISRLFNALTVEENVRVALLHRDRVASRFWRPAPARRYDEAVEAALSRLRIEPLARRTVRDLSLGQKRLVELTLALAMEPKVLLLDEPAAGIPRTETPLVLEAVNQLPADLSILLIEHDMDIVFGWARRILVLSAGALLADDDPRTIARDEQVQRVYFGLGEVPHVA